MKGKFLWYLLAILVCVIPPTALFADAQPREEQLTPTPESTPVDELFQEVVVDQHTFLVDSFYPCQSFIVARISKLGTAESETLVVTTITIQMFIRSGDQMIAIDAYSTFDSEVTSGVEVGGSFSCKPPVAQEVTG